MKKTVAVWLAVGFIFAFCGAVSAAEEVVSGVVSVEKDEAGAVVKVAVVVNAELVYSVKLDENGNKVAALVGKQVVVTGDVVEEEGKKVMAVATVAAVEVAVEEKPVEVKVEEPVKK